MAKDYYQILGVGKSATADEVKKAYRKLAHEHHPDKKHGNEAKFKEINEAYQVLGNEQKRKQYDQFGSVGSGFGGGAGGGWEDIFRSANAGSSGAGGFAGFDFGNFEDVFSDIFGFGGGRRGRHERQNRGNDIQIELSLEFLEAAFGAQRTITLEKLSVCSACSGLGAAPGSSVKTCGRCHGQGEITSQRSSILGVIQTRTICPVCAGAGKVNGKNCPVCAGAGRQRRREDIKIKIPAGVDDGQTVRLTGLGEAGETGGPAGDLYVRVRVRRHKKFRRRDEFIETGENITIAQAVLGDKINVETIHGPVELKIPSGTKSGSVIKLAGKGVPLLHGSGSGDHLVKIDVQIPAKLSKKQKQLFEELRELEKDKSFWQ